MIQVQWYTMVVELLTLISCKNIYKLSVSMLPLAQLCAVNVVSGKEAIVLVGEQNREGLCSILTSRCVGCNKELQFSTSSRVQGMSGGRYWECNLAAVWGQMATGEGHVPLTESMVVLGIPSLSKKAFMSTKKRIGEWWWNLFKESMKQAGISHHQPWRLTSL